MFLLIFESIGTSELILIGIIALIFLGPRKLPQLAKTVGKTLADFRNTTNEFKSTWEREVNFEEEERALRTGDLPAAPVARATPEHGSEPQSVSVPQIKHIDKSEFDEIVADQNGSLAKTNEDVIQETVEEETDTISDKGNWL